MREVYIVDAVRTPVGRMGGTLKNTQAHEMGGLVCKALMERTDGSNWKELNVAVQQIIEDYAGLVNLRSEDTLTAGYKYLCDLQRRGEEEISCSNAHELMRTLEAFELLQVGKLICLCARERRETRGNHKRADYTFTNPLNDNMFVTIKQVDGEPKVGWRSAT